MSIVIIALKILFYSLFGYYIESLLNSKDNPFYGPISLFYGLFGILAIFSDKIPIVYLFVLGICWGILVNMFLGVINPRLETALEPKYFGLLHIVNVLLIERFFNWLFISSKVESITSLFIFGISFFIIDIALTLRRLL